MTNLLVRTDGHVTGVLDYDRACWGDVERDLAIAEYCGVTEEPFRQGYGREVKTHDGDAAVRRFFYLLHEQCLKVVPVVERFRSELMVCAVVVFQAGSPTKACW